MRVSDRAARPGQGRPAWAASACATLGAVLTGWWGLSGCQAYDPALLGDRVTQAQPQSNVRTGPDACRRVPDFSICGRAHADGVCLDSKCTIVRCRDGFFDCDRDPETGCEATLDTDANCGACGASCALSHVARSRCDPSASDGPCVIDHGCSADADASCMSDASENGCETGFSDCDGVSSNGCEASLRTLSNCGGCGVACSIGASEATCQDGTCASTGCAVGFGDCGGSGCASLANNPLHCGACNNPCGASAAMCAGGRCTSASCRDGRGDCDGDASNGCEADLTGAATCGSCSVRCGPYAHAIAGCADGRCTLAGCDSGFQDCDKARDNGCEVDGSQLASCGACGNDCSKLPHVVAAECVADQCANLTCESAWGDCDGDRKNGCEQPLNTNDHCGSCAGACSPSYATGSCQTGHCTISACAEGHDDCDGNVENGCEAVLSDNSSCGACGKVCASGTICQSGGCSCAGGACSDGTACCSGTCVDTQSICFPWPCIPGTSRDRNNCGGCGVRCAGWCCA